MARLAFVAALSLANLALAQTIQNGTGKLNFMIHTLRQ